MASTGPESRKREKPSASPSLPFLKGPPPSLFPSKQEVPKVLIAASIALFVAVACNQTVRFFNSQPKPFCDTNETTQDLFSDVCEPCPKNGQCFEGNWECLPGYKKHGRLCVEDGEINPTAKKLFEWAQHHVCEAYAQFLCGGTGTIWAMEEIRGYLIKRIDLNGIKEFKCPDLLSDQYKPLLCKIFQSIYRNSIFILPYLVLLLGFTKLIMRIRQGQYLSTRAGELYEQVCNKLEEAAFFTMSMKIEGDPEGNPGVVASELRDHLLFPGERKDTFLWKKVEELVLEDSRIDQSTKLVKGKPITFWEWQGEEEPLAVDEGMLPEQA